MRRSEWLRWVSGWQRQLPSGHALSEGRGVSCVCLDCGLSVPFPSRRGRALVRRLHADGGAVWWEYRPRSPSALRKVCLLRLARNPCRDRIVLDVLRS